jgi:uncharacterized membrane protein (UPF0127 family)
MRFLAYAVCLLLCGCVHAKATKACFSDSCVAIEIVDDDASRAQGLMFRDALPPGRGMLFIFPQEAVYGFWMKNMRFPLDIIWIDRLQRVADISAMVPACTQAPCPTYRPHARIRYVLEVNAGFTHAHHIHKGDKVEFK